MFWTESTTAGRMTDEGFPAGRTTYVYLHDDLPSPTLVSGIVTHSGQDDYCVKGGTLVNIEKSFRKRKATTVKATSLEICIVPLRSVVLLNNWKTN